MTVTVDAQPVARTMTATPSAAMTSFCGRMVLLIIPVPGIPGLSSVWRAGDETSTPRVSVRPRSAAPIIRRGL